MVGAVAGTPGTRPTGWPFIVVNNGLVSSIVGTGTESGIAYLDLQISGTATAAAIAAVSFGRGTALTAQTWTVSSYIKLAAGSLSGVTGMTLDLIEETAATVFVAGAGYSISLPTTASLITQRPAASRTLTGGANVALLRTNLSVNVSSGSTVDFTIRIGLPQLEQGAFATSPILTSTAAVTRNADVASITGSAFSGWANVNEGSLYADVAGYMNDALAGQRTVASITDGTYGNNFAISKSAAGATWRADGFSGGGAAQASFTGPYSAGVFSKIAFAYALNNANASFNGSIGTTDTSVPPPVAPNRLELRDPIGASGGHPTYTIRRLTYWPQRLPNASLQTLTQ